MRKEEELTALLRGLAELVAQEVERNPDFAAKVDALLSGMLGTSPPARSSRTSDLGPRTSDLGPRTSKLRPRTSDLGPTSVPDIHTELKVRGDADFRSWLRDLPLPVLRALIRTHDFDPKRSTAKAIDQKRLADFIASKLHQRLARGSAFIGRKKDS